MGWGYKNCEREGVVGLLRTVRGGSGVIRTVREGGWGGVIRTVREGGWGY